MAFKMKGSSYKMGGTKTKATMAYMKSPLEAAKPDYPDIDGDGNTTESMKKAAADKKSPLEQAVTQASLDAEGNPDGNEYVGTWKETKADVEDMSRRERRKAVKETKQDLPIKESGKQKTYWDPTSKMHKKIPGIFSSKAAKEDFIIKQTMKKRDKGSGEGMSREQMQEYKDAGIDPTTMGRRTELDSE